MWRTSAVTQVLRPRASILETPQTPTCRERGRHPSRCCQLPVLYASEHLLVVNKPADMRMDGDCFPITVEALAQKQISDPGSALAEQVRPTGWHRVGHARLPLPPPRVRMIHQLDYATSGVLLLGLQKRPTAHINIAFRKRQVRKRYLALVHGHLRLDEKNQRFIVDAPLLEYVDDFRIRLMSPMKLNQDPTCEMNADQVVPEKRPADATEYTVVEDGLHSGSNEASADRGVASSSSSSFRSQCDDSLEHEHVVHLEPCRSLQPLPGTVLKKAHQAVTYGRVIMVGSFRDLPATLVELWPETGRRHQLRVHLWGIGHGIIGDATYPTLPDEDDRFPRMMLHAAELELPLYLQERFHLPARFEATLPAEMAEFTSEVSSHSS